MRNIIFVALFSTVSCLMHTAPLYIRSAPPTGWTQVSQTPVEDEKSVTFMIALKQNNIATLESIATAVSDPKSPKYQQFLSIAEITAMVSPSSSVQNLVIDTLIVSGIDAKDIKNLGDALDVRASVKAASTFFNTKFMSFKHSETEQEVIKTNQYSLPKSVLEHIEMVAGISTFPIPHLDAHEMFQDSVKGALRGVQNIRLRDAVANGDVSFVPQTIFQMYNIPSETYMNATSEPFDSQGVIEFTGPSQSYSPTDLQSFGDKTNIKVIIPSATTTIGVNNPATPGLEAQLDVEAMATVNDEGQMWFWIEAGTAWQYSFATHFFATVDVPAVSSISYAWSEMDQCQAGVGSTDCSALGITDSSVYVTRVNTEFAKIATRGLSLLSASGDSGANGRTDGGCTIPMLKPDYPAASPWITSVGATQLSSPVTLTNPPPICTGLSLPCAASGVEEAVSFATASFTSGGGFSWYSPRPAWQEAAVSAYLASGTVLPTASYFNATNRGFPDIAALGHNMVVVLNGASTLVGGTSVSAPIVASMFSMLNQISMEKTKKPLGFLSPLIYQMYEEDSTIFQDVTVGDNKCTEYGCAATCQGFLCAKGWDPVTGLGSLNFGKAQAYLNKMFDEKAKLLANHAEIA